MTTNAKLFSILAYFPLLWLVGMFVEPEKNDPFVRFHANQGLALIIANAAVYFLSFLSGALCSVSWVFIILLLPCMLLNMACIALAVLGIINAIRGKAKELPVIGKIKLLRW